MKAIKAMYISGKDPPEEVTIIQILPTPAPFSDTPIPLAVFIGTDGALHHSLITRFSRCQIDK